jgi:hypothetical protein
MSPEERKQFRKDMQGIMPGGMQPTVHPDKAPGK